jgi:hypothetical protein
MAKKRPWHTKAKTKVYHNDSRCTEGDNIQKRNLAKGTGGHRLCKSCKKRR